MSSSAQERKKARRRALQALYQWQVKGQEESAEMLIEQFLAHQDFEGVDQVHFEAIISGVVASAEDYDRRMAQYTDRPMADVDQMERVVLRLAAFELIECPDLPSRIILDEAIDLAHRFGAEQAHAFINGVLDKAARNWRPDEFTES